MYLAPPKYQLLSKAIFRTSLPLKTLSAFPDLRAVHTALLQPVQSGRHGPEFMSVLLNSHPKVLLRALVDADQQQRLGIHPTLGPICLAASPESAYTPVREFIFHITPEGPPIGVEQDHSVRRNALGTLCQSSSGPPSRCYSAARLAALRQELVDSILVVQGPLPLMERTEPRAGVEPRRVTAVGAPKNVQSSMGQSISRTSLAAPRDGQRDTPRPPCRPGDPRGCRQSESVIIS